MIQIHVMNTSARSRSVGSRFVLALASCVPLCLSASAQQNAAQQSIPSAASAILETPSGVGRLIAIDAHSMLLAESTPGPNSEPGLWPVNVKHVYPGGIARLFGGIIVPTETFVSPALTAATTDITARNARNNASATGISTTSEFVRPTLDSQFSGNFIQGAGNPLGTTGIFRPLDTGHVHIFSDLTP
jgi:hypothetical protein